MSVNRGRVFLGGLAGGVVWFVWGFVVNFFMLGEARYQAAQSAGLFLKQPRYPLFPVQWAVILLVSAIILAHLYAWARQTMGPGPEPPSRSACWWDLLPGSPRILPKPAGRPSSASSLSPGCWKCGWEPFWRPWSRDGCTRNKRASRLGW